MRSDIAETNECRGQFFASAIDKICLLQLSTSFHHLIIYVN